MNGTQVFLTISYSLLVLVSCVVTAIILRSTRAKRRGEVKEEVLAENENRWGIVVVALLVTMLAATIWQLPYDDTEAEGAAQRVAVQGQQFGWSVQPNRVRAGVPVEFTLRSKDVQHGFGIYEGNKLLKQVQVPAKDEPDQKITYTFEKPGTYEILCLEFCGYQHHMMRGQMRVE